MIVIVILGAFGFGIFLGALAGLGIGEHLKLRKELKAAQKAIAARETAPQPALKEVQERVSGIEGELRKIVEPLFREPPDDAPRFSGIGPSDIASRELYDRQQAQEKATPKFASPSVLNPDLKDIREAAREATNGGKPN